MPALPPLRLPVRPRGWGHEHCVNGHVLEPGGGYETSPDHDLRTRRRRCALCSDLGMPRAAWLEVDLAPTQRGSASGHLGLAVRPPATTAGVGQIVVEWHGRAIADLDLRVCEAERVGVIEHLRVDAAYLRHGIGTLLIAAALARGPGYAWSTTVLANTAESRAFWASLLPNQPLRLGDPRYCPHMLAEDESVL